MSLPPQSAPRSGAALWTSRVLVTLVTLFILLDGAIHVARPAPVAEAFRQLGWPIGLSVPLAIVQTVRAVVYALPRSAVLGAILLTGYLGGAVATQARIGSPSFLFPVLLGVLAWLGLFLRDGRLRSLIPWRRGDAGAAG